MENEVAAPKPLFPVEQVSSNLTPATWLANASFSECLLPPPLSLPTYPEILEAEKLPGDTEAGREKSVEVVIDDDEDRKKRKRKKTEPKDYYFDSHGDRDNLAFGQLYRLDISRYRLNQSRESLQDKRKWNRKMDLLNPEQDEEQNVKSGSRYWSSKIALRQRRRDFKRLRIAYGAQSKLELLTGSFIPLDLEDSKEKKQEKITEESWDDYVIRKTREFNQLTREQPQNENLWMSFIKFQDELIQSLQKKVLVQHAIDKKISVLERVLEFHPNNEEFLLLYLETCRKRDDVASMLSKWEQMIAKHNGSYKLWRSYVKFRCSTFSSFSVSSLRKVFAQGIRALFNACNRQRREEQKKNGNCSQKIIDAEVALVSFFVDLCRFEWQTGHHELAVGLFQAEFEYGFLCPPIQLTENNKLRLFEAFWGSRAARIGENGALGWTMWMEKEEEQIQKAKSMKPDEESENMDMDVEKDVLKSSHHSAHGIHDERQKEEEDGEEDEKEEEEEEEEEDEEEDDAALLEKLGLSLDPAKEVEVKDTLIWKRWSEEESNRDRLQWLALRAGVEEGDELEREVLFEDVREYLFSLSTEDARFHLIGQFMDFCDAPLSQWCCSNSQSYKGSMDSIEAISEKIRERISISEDSIMGSLVGCEDWIHAAKGRTEFLRNTLMLLRSFFCGHLEFHKALLFLQSLQAAERDDTADAAAAFRALAKRLLKLNRQDLTLWAAYSCMEASAGNILAARKVFDTALMSLAALPKEARLDAPIVYLAYAEVEIELGQASKVCHSQRVASLLYYLGSGEPFSAVAAANDDVTAAVTPLTTLQVEKARSGFRDQLQKLRHCGELNERGRALITCAALFQEMSSGWQSAASIFQDSFTTAALPAVTRQRSIEFERLFLDYIHLLQLHKESVKPAHIRSLLTKGISHYPFNSQLLSAYAMNCLKTSMRLFFDEQLERNPSNMLWLFALSYEMCVGDSSQHRIGNLFERAVEEVGSGMCVVIWRCYLGYELLVRKNVESARRVFFRAIHACPWSKALWMDGFEKMSSVLSAKEQSEFLEIIREKELRIRTDVYEIMLEDVELDQTL